MSLTILTPPGAEPVTLAQAKAWLRVSHADEDALIGDLIAAAREQVERHTGRALIARQLRETLDGWPLHRISACGSAFALKAPPLISVEAVRVYQADGEAVIWNPAEYRVDADSDPGRLIANAPYAFPKPGRRAGGVEIDFTAGYGPAEEDVPAALRVAVLHLVASAYSNADPAESAQRGPGGLPGDVAELLKPYAQVRL